MQLGAQCGESSGRLAALPSTVPACSLAPALSLPLPPPPQDLESRKRAPLYQKKQEEELKAAQDKAAEAEIRAGEAELKYKEARVRGAGGVGEGRWV